MSAQRVYIGGLTPDIKLDDIIGRFKPFGEVHACDIVRGKSLTSDPSQCRGFAYVSFTPKDAAALSRVFSLYNGCKWRGQKLRVELAKPDFLTKLQKEWQEQQQEAEKQANCTTGEQHTVPTADENEAEADQNKTTIRITMPGKRKSVVVDLTAKAKSYRAWFPAHKEKRVADLSWEPLPPSKRVALQAIAETTQKPATAAAAAALMTPSVSEQQRQRVAEPAKGAAVPYQYKEQQQQQQPSKGMTAQVDAEHWSQLKLLKRIAEQEKAAALQQQQFEQLQQRSTAAAAAVQATVKSVVAPPQQQQQQQVKQVPAVPAGVVVMSDDDEDAAADGVDIASLAQQLSKFDDSDSEDDGATAAAGQDLLVPGRPQQSSQATAAAAAARHAAGDTLKQQPALGRKQQQEEEAAGEDAGSDEELSDDSRDSAELDVAAAALPAAQQLPGQEHGTDSSQQDTGGSESSEQEVEGGSEETEPQWEAQQSPTQPQSKVCKPQQQQQQQQSSHQAALAAQAAEGGASAAPGSSPEAGEEGDEAGSVEADSEGEQQQQQQQLVTSESEGEEAEVEEQQQQQQQHVLQPQQQQQQQTVLVQPLPVVSFVGPSEAAQAESAVALLTALDRFGSDSEEVLVDVDEQDTAAVATAASSKPRAGMAKQQGSKARPAVGSGSSSKGRRDELLCPVAPRPETGRAAVLGLTGKQQRWQQQGAQAGSISRLQQKPQKRTPGAGQNMRHSN